jgi:hypothetical protein
MDPAASSEPYYSDDELINDYIQEDFEAIEIDYDEAYMLEVETDLDTAPSTTATAIDDRHSPFKGLPIQNGVVVNPYTKRVSPERVSPERVSPERVSPERVSRESNEAAESLISLTTLSVTPLKRPPSASTLAPPTKRSSYQSYTTPLPVPPPKRSTYEHTSFITPSPTSNEVAALSFNNGGVGVGIGVTVSCPSLRQMIIDFKTTISDNRGRGSNLPNHAIDSIVSTIPIPVTFAAMRSVPHVGKVLLKTHGISLVAICKQYVSDFLNWQSLQVSSFPTSDVNEANANHSPTITLNSNSYFHFLRPQTPVGEVKDLYFSTCKKALNGYNIVLSNDVDNNTPTLRVRDTITSITSNQDSLPSEYIVSPLNARRASLEDLMQVLPGTALQLLIPTHVKSKKKGGPMSMIKNNFCLQQGIPNYAEYPAVNFSGIQYAVVPALVRTNPKRLDMMSGNLRQTDLQRYYDQKEGISLNLPSLPEPIRLWWQHVDPHLQRHPVIVWGTFGFGNRNFNKLFLDHSDMKRNQHMFAMAARETETDVGSTYALIKAYQSIQSNVSNRSLKRISLSTKKFDKQINLRDKCVTLI